MVQKFSSHTPAVARVVRHHLDQIWRVVAGFGNGSASNQCRGVMIRMSAFVRMGDDRVQRMFRKNDFKSLCKPSDFENCFLVNAAQPEDLLTRHSGYSQR